MGLGTKLIADYVEMINAELDQIPVKRGEDFKLVAQELQQIICTSLFSSFKGAFLSKPKPTLSRQILDQIDYIRFCYNNPKEYVASSSDYSEYKNILKERITAKIKEFQDFNLEDKKAYIAFQKEIHPPVPQSTENII